MTTAEKTPPSSARSNSLQFDNGDRLFEAQPERHDTAGSQHSSPLNGSVEADEIPLTIPHGHLTTTGSLLGLKEVKKLIGEYPEDFFLIVESQRDLEFEIPTLLNLSEALMTLHLDREVTDSLVATFFSHIHPQIPLIDYEDFVHIYENVLAQGASNDFDTALCLIIFAFGSLASETPSHDGVPAQNHLRYFSIAYHIWTRQWATTFRTDLSLPLGLVYGAMFLCYMNQPLQAWKMVHMASTNMQLFASQYEIHQPKTKQRNKN